MLRVARSLPVRINQKANFSMSSRKLAGDDNPIYRAADKIGEKVSTDSKVPFSPTHLYPLLCTCSSILTTLM
jgi:hypothetical protein